MKSFCLHITWNLYGFIAVFCLWKVVHAKNFAALLHKLNMRCLVNLYDVRKEMLFEATFFYSLYLWKHSQSCILSSLCTNKNDVINRFYKIVDDSKTKQGIK